MIIERSEQNWIEFQKHDDVTKSDQMMEEKYIEGCAVLQMDHHKQILCTLYNCYVESRI